MNRAQTFAGRLQSGLFTQSSKPPAKLSSDAVFAQHPDPVFDPIGDRAKL